MANLKPVTDDTFESLVLKSNVPALVDFSATWCGPCKQLTPTLEQLAREYEGKVNFFGVDVDQARQIATRFGIMSVPTVMVFRNGQVVGQALGNKPRDFWTGMLDDALAR
ncbi:MAG: thioredoxin [Acidobacteria bacterium]|nr:thioredoxin [Acidobacteriota bacterium]